jgi:hypothetical protein
MHSGERNITGSAYSLWKFGEPSHEGNVFVMIKVSYGDRPVGCIAIAALRETVNNVWRTKRDPPGFSRKYVHG